jgi:hypothetical protein
MSRTWKTAVRPDSEFIDVPVTVQGPDGQVETAWLVLDTGSPVTILRTAVAKDVGLTEALSVGRSHLLGPTGPDDGYRVSAPGFTVLGRTLRGFILSCHEIDPGLDVDGVVGLDVLRHGRLVLEMPAGRVTFAWL